MDKDIIPELLTSIDEKFKNDNAESAILKSVVEKLKSGMATYEDVNKLAIEIGTNLSKAINEFVTAESLPDGKMYFNISDRLMNHTLKNNYDIVSGYAEDVQNQLNKNSNLHLKAQVPEFNQEKVKGLVERLTNAEKFDDISWILNEPLVTFTQSIVDDSIQKNVDFQYKAGLQPRITRTVVGKPCKWCRNLAGSYLYSKAPKDVYRRHERCRCIVEYRPGDGRRQNVWSKAWKDPKKDDKIEARKQLNISSENGAKNYIRNESADYLLSKNYVKKEKYAFIQYDEIKNSNQKIEKRKIYSNLGKFKSMKDFSKSDVNIAFNHVFNDVHELSNGETLFKPDYDMAHSWERLINGNNILEHDLIMLKHERLEHDYMYVTDNLEYDLAHAKANEVYNYGKNIPKKG